MPHAHYEIQFCQTTEQMRFKPCIRRKFVKVRLIWHQCRLCRDVKRVVTELTTVVRRSDQDLASRVIHLQGVSRSRKFFGGVAINPMSIMRKTMDSK